MFKFGVALLLLSSYTAFGQDPLIPYLNGKVPGIIKDLGEEVDSVKVRKIVFQSRPIEINGIVSSNEVFAVIARPLKPGKYPGLLVLHGGGGSSEINRVRKWAAKGYIALSLDIPGVAAPDKVPESLGHWKTLPYGSHRFVAIPDLTHSTIFDGVLASVQGLYLLHAQTDVIKDRIGITGVSWGGYMTTFISGVANSYVRASFSTYGSGFYDVASVFLKELDKMPKTDREMWLKYLDAGRRSNKIKSPFFIAAATNDNWFYPPAVMATLKEIKGDAQHFFAPNANHSAAVPGGNSSSNRVGFMQMEEPYFDYHLKGIGLPLPKISIIGITRQKKKAHGSYNVKFLVDTKTTVVNATVFYSAADVAWTKRKWNAVKALKLSGNVYSAEIPADFKDKNTWCFASISDDRPVTVSSDLKALK